MQELFAALPALLREHGDNDLVRRSVAFAAWRHVAGDSLCEHTAPIAFEDGRLAIAVADRSWQRNLKELSGEMIHRINSTLRYSLVKFIEFRIDKAVVHETAKRDTARSQFESEALDQITAPLRKAADIIRDDETRRKFLLAAASCLTRQKRMSAGD